MGGARRRRDMAAHPRRRARRVAAGRNDTERRGDHESKGDHRRVGQAYRTTAPSGPGLAGPAYSPAVPRAGRGAWSRLCDPPNRIGLGSVLFGHENRVAVPQRARLARPGGWGRCGVRDYRCVAGLPAHLRRVVRDGSLQRIANTPLQHRPPGVGHGSSDSVRRARDRATRGSPFERGGGARRWNAPGFRSSYSRHRGRSAGCALRAGLLGVGSGKMHLRHGGLSVDECGRPSGCGSPGGWHAHHDWLRCRRCSGIRTGGFDLHRGRCGSVVA